MLDTNLIRKDFPVLERLINNKPIRYLDNACVTLRPKQVIEAIIKYYNEFPGCHGRAMHRFARLATEAFMEARATIANFIGASDPAEIIFVKNTTEAINMVAYGLDFAQGDKVIITNLEHNSNLLPWQDKKFILNIVNLSVDHTFNLNEYQKAIEGAKLVSVYHISHISGVETPVKEIVEIAHKNKAMVLLDAAQSIAYKEINVKELDVDFLAFSAHKMFGPSGIGVLWGKRRLLENMRPLITGGSTVLETTYDSKIMADIPDVFEAGLQDYAGAIGTAAAVRYISSIGKKNIEAHLLMLNKILTDYLMRIDGISIIGPQDPSLRGGICNFTVGLWDAHELARILDETENLMLRSGKMCAHAWYNSTATPESLRASFSIYNTPQELECLSTTLKKVLKYFK